MSCEIECAIGSRWSLGTPGQGSTLACTRTHAQGAWYAHGAWQALRKYCVPCYVRAVHGKHMAVVLLYCCCCAVHRARTVYLTTYLHEHPGAVVGGVVNEGGGAPVAVLAVLDLALLLGDAELCGEIGGLGPRPVHVEPLPRNE